MYIKCLKVRDAYFIIDMITGDVYLSSEMKKDTPYDEYVKEFHMSYPFSFQYDEDVEGIKILMGKNYDHYVVIYNSSGYLTNLSLKFDLNNDLFDNLKTVLRVLYKTIPIMPIYKSDCYIVTLKTGVQYAAKYMTRRCGESDKCFLNINTCKGNTVLFQSYGIKDIDLKFGRYTGAWPEYNSKKQKMFFDWINSNYLAIANKERLEIKQLKNKHWIIHNSLNVILEELGFYDVSQMREYIFEKTGNKLGIFPEFKDKESLLKFIEDRKNEL